jgi:hypothetical protein
LLIDFGDSFIVLLCREHGAETFLLTHTQILKPAHRFPHRSEQVAALMLMWRQIRGAHLASSGEMVVTF